MWSMTSDERARPKRTLFGCLIGVLGVLAILTALAAAGWVLYGGITAVGGPDDQPQVNPNLSQAQRLYLGYYFSQNEDRLNLPAGNGTQPVSFTIAPGEGASTIAANLAAVGLLSDTELFLNYLTYYGLDGGLVAGEHVLEPQMTVPQLAEAIGSGRSQTLTLSFLPGWRSEEMANYLNVVRPAQIDPEAFLEAVQTLRGVDTRQFAFLRNHPSGASLEGYLFPGQYPITRDTTSPAVVEMMLAEFDRMVSPDMRQSIGAQGLSLRDAVILASIIEKEASVPDEKPIMAGVFLNRLRNGMPLQADPTVQYALGFQADRNTWWKAPLDATDLQFESPYNTYVVSGLPPGPISNPSLASLRAVAYPADTDFLFFVLDCQAQEPGRHIFSVTYDEHVANIQRCR
jgi:UPF0755 protein